MGFARKGRNTVNSLPTEVQVLSYFEELSNWQRWGQNDELGTLNLITPGKRRQALASVTEGIVVSCAALIAKGKSESDVPYPPLHFMIRSGESLDPLRPGALEFLGLVFHGLTVTHVDALSHSFFNGHTYGGRSRNVVTTELGATALSVDVMKDSIFTRGVLLDIAGSNGLRYLEPGCAIYVEDLEAAEISQGVSVCEGDALLVHTGSWLYRIENGPSIDRKRPGLHASTLPWLRERGVAVLATDAANDVVPSGYENIELPIHEIGQVAMGLCIIDCCDLESLMEACRVRARWDFLFQASPLRIEYGTGSPVNPIAIL